MCRVQVSGKHALFWKHKGTWGAFKVCKGWLIEFWSPSDPFHRSLPLVGLTPIYSSFVANRDVSCQVPLNREILVTLRTIIGGEWFFFLTLFSLPFLTPQPEIWQSVTLCSLDSFFAVRLPHLAVCSLILPVCVVNPCFVEVSFDHTLVSQLRATASAFALLKVN